jgi:tetratricopeptide (TPR) repeat protein
VDNFPEFPEYGSGGDKLGARRMRRSFRFAVAASVLLALVFFFAERYLRYDLSETQYIMALTLPTESARPILRQAVKRDAEKLEFQTPKYVAALAEREERDQILPAYEAAYILDPNNGFLALRYGSQLFLAERYEEARERYREASAQPPDNALPDYLQAAAIGMNNPGDEDFSESLSLVAKTNTAGEPIVFPGPFWSTELSKDGIQYNRLRRQIVDESCAPLYKYTERIVRAARSHIALKQLQYWDSWLGTLQGMGDRLMTAQDGGSLQAMAGIYIQLQAIEQREAIAITEGRNVPELVALKTRLQSAMEELSAFENSRDTVIGADYARFYLPLRLCWLSLVASISAYLLAYLAGHIVRTRRVTWSLPHGRSGLLTVGIGTGLLFLMLCLTALAQYLGPHVGIPVEGASQLEPVAWLAAVAFLWWGVILFMLAFGLVYPSLCLPSVRRVLRERDLPEDDAVRGIVGRWRRLAYLSLVRRYYGILCGLLLSTMSLWVILYRVAFSMYPWQLQLLVTGLGPQELQVVKRVAALVFSAG